MKTISIREQAIETINNMDEQYFTDLVVRGHKTHSHEWVEVLPNGTIKEAEEADNNSSHYISYPDKEVANIYDIHQQSAEKCGCEVCRMYRDFNELTKEEFVENWNKDIYDYVSSTDYEDAIMEDAHDNDIYEDDVRQQMVDAVEEIAFGYFDDEEHVVEDVDLMKAGYGHDTLTWTLDGEEQSCTGEFYVDKEGMLHHTAIAANGDEVEITIKY